MDLAHGGRAGASEEPGRSCDAAGQAAGRRTGGLAAALLPRRTAGEGRILPRVDAVAPTPGGSL